MHIEMKGEGKNAVPVWAGEPNPPEKKVPLWMTLHMIQESAVVKARNTSRGLWNRFCIWMEGETWFDRLFVYGGIASVLAVVWMIVYLMVRP